MIEIIADLSSNHNGQIETAKTMIQRAKDAGVNTIKIQSWRADKLSKNFNGDFQNTYERHKKTELSNDDHIDLIDFCNKIGVNFLTTCFDIERVDFLASLGLNAIKVASPDCHSISLIKKLQAKFRTIYISTGMMKEDEIIDTVNLLGDHDYIMLHCRSLYPTPLSHINLNRIHWLKDLGVKKVGFSDHSLGTDAAKAAMTMGITCIEKHLTLNRDWPGKDQKMSTTPEEFYEICRWRDLCESMMGQKTYQLTKEEHELRKIYIGKWGNNA